MKDKVIGIYCRLSKEDSLNESLSIINQKSILISYVEEKFHEDYKVYVDDGYSGTSLNRPALQELINDIKKGLITTVITKDLSRLGRNYIQVGLLTEELFIKYNVRYIAINDNYDSYQENDFAPFKNIINEWYAKDISKKVRFTLKENAKKGKNKKTTVPLYGYKYNDLGERKLDGNTYWVVQLIFDEFIKRKNISDIRKILCAKKIYSPGYYNYITYNVNAKKYRQIITSDKYNWLNQTIKSILKNEEYIGHYITHKTETLSYKINQRKKTNEQYVFKNKYPKIIDERTFNAANELLNTSTKEVQINNLYQGSIYCGGCLKKMSYQKNKQRFFCSNKKCNKKGYVTISLLDNIVMSELEKLKERILDEPIFEYLIKNDNTYLNSLYKKNEILENNIKLLLRTPLNYELINYINDYQKEIIENRKLIAIEENKVNTQDNILYIERALQNINLKEYLKYIIFKINIYKKEDGKAKRIEILFYKFK